MGKIIIIIIIIIIIQTYLCRIAASVLRKKTAINAGPGPIIQEKPVKAANGQIYFAHSLP